MWRPRPLAAIKAIAAACILAGCCGAYAASVGGVTSSKLTASAMSASTGAPAVVAWEAFTGTTGASLNGTTTDGGGLTWAVNPSGTWTIQTNSAASTTASTSLVVNAGTWNGSVEATINRNGATTFAAGLTVNRNSGGTQYLAAEWTNATNGSLLLRLYNGAFTNLASVTNLYPGGIATAPASIKLRLTTSSTGTLTAYIDGAQVVTTTLSAANQTTFKNSTHQLFGLYQRTSNGVRWDDFHLDNP